MKQLIVFLSFLYLPLQSGAWGAVGHRLVAKIASNQLSQKAKDSVSYYLGGASMADVSNWMDEIKSNPSYDSLRVRHYINIEKGAAYNLDSTHNIIGELNRVLGELRHRGNLSKERIEMDLKILIHLIGDLHQPLHVGYASDRGGNDIPVYFAGIPSNLHKVWDTHIVEEYVALESPDWANTANYGRERMDSVKRIDLVAWMKESRSNLEAAYNFKDNEIRRKYINWAKPIIKERLFFGGIRLAELLNEIFHA